MLAAIGALDTALQQGILIHAEFVAAAGASDVVVFLVLIVIAAIAFAVEIVFQGIQILGPLRPPAR